MLSESWVTRNLDGSIKDFGIRQFRHYESYCVWNNEKSDWYYITVDCNCKLCKQEKNK